jgi:nucleoside-diphosphate-sugar epimerase
VRTVITGGAGFIGLALARRLARLSGAGDEVILVDTLGRHGMHAELERVLGHPCLRLVQGDLTLAASLGPIPVPVDRVYHLAGRVGVGPVTAAPADVLRTNTLSTLNVFEWFVGHASSGARLLFASTSEVYSGAALSGFDLPVPTPEEAPAVISDLGSPRFSYALTKMWGEAYATYLSREAGVLMASVRYHNVYGPRMGNDHVIPQIIDRVRAQEEPFRIIGADQTRSFCWIEDAVEATHRILESPRLTPGTVVHVGNQKGEVEIGRLYEMIFDLCGWAPRTLVNRPAPPGSVSRRCPDVTRLRSLTEYEPSTPLREGLEKTVKWYLEQVR